MPVGGSRMGLGSNPKGTNKIKWVNTNKAKTVNAMKKKKRKSK